MSANRTKFDFDRVDRRTTNITPALITAIRDRIVDHLHPEKIILFGSHTSGTATDGSDIDLLVVLDDDHPLASLKRRDRYGALLELFRYRSFGLDAFVLTNGEIRKTVDQNEGEWDLILEILGTGTTLYDQTQETQTE